MIKIIKFRQNDLIPTKSKQIEFNKNVVTSFFQFTEDEVKITITYKSLDGSGSLNNRQYQSNLTLSPKRGDYKIYQNTDGSKDLKDLFIEDLHLNVEDNINDYFALEKNDNTNYDLYYIPATTSISVFLDAIKNKAFDFSAETEINVADYRNEIIEDSKLRNIIYKTFKYIVSRYGEECILQGSSRRTTSINKVDFTSIVFPDYFNNENILLTSSTSLSKDDLSSSGTLRYFESNLGLKISPNTYFTTQWYGQGDEAASLANFNRFLANISDDALEVIDDNNIFKLVNKKGITHSINNNEIGENKIYFGAPGTGKSYEIKKQTDKLGNRARRITFHPDYDYASFVGGYMPVTEKEEKDGVEVDVIKYKFVPQIFSQIYSDAWLDKDNRYCLIIEEINRGNCAEIFGDIFQLLDRKTDYPISATKEMVAFLNAESAKKGLEKHLGLAHGDKLSLPPNLSILATMNTSDQSLYPMDSAFKRRWDWEYLPIDYPIKDENGQITNDNKSFGFKVKVGNSFYPWIKFIEEVNNIISTNKSLGMDKCIGNYFIEPSADGYIELSDFIHKVIFYLWDDVFKDEVESIFEENESYESFFPISTNGSKKIEKLFENLNIKPDTADEITD